jgi:hypothetical protein
MRRDTLSPSGKLARTLSYIKGASFTAMTVVAALRTVLKEDKEMVFLREYVPSIVKMQK